MPLQCNIVGYMQLCSFLKDIARTISRHAERLLKTGHS